MIEFSNFGFRVCLNFVQFHLNLLELGGVRVGFFLGGYLAFEIGMAGFVGGRQSGVCLGNKTVLKPESPKTQNPGLPVTATATAGDRGGHGGHGAPPHTHTHRLNIRYFIALRKR